MKIAVLGKPLCDSRLKKLKNGSYWIIESLRSYVRTQHAKFVDIFCRILTSPRLFGFLFVDEAKTGFLVEEYFPQSSSKNPIPESTQILGLPGVLNALRVRNHPPVSTVKMIPSFWAF